MLKSYFKTTIRFLFRSRTFGLINIIGLSIGTLCCLYILLYVHDQYSYDRQSQDVYRVTTSIEMNGDRHRMASASPPIAPAMKDDFPEVAYFARAIPTLDNREHLVSYKEKSFYETDAYQVDSGFFKVFNYHFTSGNPAHALSGANSLVLMKSLAEKLFGNEDPLGKVITINDAYGHYDFSVSGVVDESLGRNSLYANFFIKLNPNGYSGNLMANNNWAGNNFAYSYVRLKAGVDARRLEGKLPAFLTRHGEQQLRNLGMKKTLHLQPVSEIHTTAGYQAEPGRIVSRSFLYILILIALLIQVIACINFMNLSTARASRRAKEVCVRKVAGAGRGSLMAQFLGESFLLALLSVLITIPLLAWTLPYLNAMTGSAISFSALGDFRVWSILTGIVILTGFAAGSYPAFYLSAFQAVKVIKGNFSNPVSAKGIRRSLVVFQFALSIMLITGIVVIYSQLSFIKNKDLGYDKSQQLIFSFHTAETRDKMVAFESELRQLPEVKNTTKSNNYPGVRTYNDWQVFLAGGNLANAVDQQNISSDENIVKTLGVKLISGRDFHANDSGSVIINETLASRLGLAVDQAPGTRLFTGSDTIGYRIAAVMKDINYRSLRDEVTPFMFIYDPGRNDIQDLIVNTRSSDYAAFLNKVEKIWRRVLPATPFVYTFLDDQVQQQYESEITMSRIINSFTIMAIFISCLGLFGLATFSAEQRNKEIGIRKVLGASVPGIVRLLSADFLKLVLIAIVIAVPISGWAMSRWLQQFAYQIHIQWWMFALSGLLAILIALITVSFQAIKSAVKNPSLSLRSSE